MSRRIIQGYKFMYADSITYIETSWHGDTDYLCKFVEDDLVVWLYVDRVVLATLIFAEWRS